MSSRSASIASAMSLLLLATVTISFYLFYYCYYQRRNLPPGPMPIPFFGNTHTFITTPIDIAMQKWKEQYGDIMTYWLGNKPIVSIHESNDIFENFVKDGEAYVGRPEFRWNDFLRGGNYGLILSEGQLWRDNRRFVLHVLRNFGMGRNLMQERVLNDVSALISHLKTEIQEGKTEFTLFDELDIAVGSIINSVTFGYRFSRDNRQEYYDVKKIATEEIRMGFWPTFRIMEANIDFFKKLPVFSQTYEVVEKHKEKSHAFFYGQIERHLKSIDFESEEEPTDFVEYFLRHKHKLDKKRNGEHNFTTEQLYATILDLWIAGQETTATTLAWLFIYVIQNPEVQRKAQVELDEFIGSDRFITLDDKVNLNYINAIVAETQRFCNLVPMNAPHKTTRNVKIRGYKIPKGTVIMNQVSTVLHDERYFPDAKTFKPERFIDKNGKFFAPAELMPFSVGKRACLGEALARLELFSFAANLLNQFSFGEVPGKPVTGERVIGANISPAPWVCSISARR